VGSKVTASLIVRRKTRFRVTRKKHFFINVIKPSKNVMKLALDLNRQQRHLNQPGSFIPYRPLFSNVIAALQKPGVLTTFGRPDR